MRTWNEIQKAKSKLERCYVQWETDSAVGFESGDLTKTADWEGMPKKPCGYLRKTAEKKERKTADWKGDI